MHRRDVPLGPPNAAVHAVDVLSDGHDTGTRGTHLLLTHEHCCPYVDTSVLHADWDDATQYVLGWHFTTEPSHEQ